MNGTTLTLKKTYIKKVPGREPFGGRRALCQIWFIRYLPVRGRKVRTDLTPSTSPGNLLYPFVDPKVSPRPKSPQVIFHGAQDGLDRASGFLPIVAGETSMRELFRAACRKIGSLIHFFFTGRGAEVDGDPRLRFFVFVVLVSIVLFCASFIFEFRLLNAIRTMLR